jgi:aryl-alcohol dehydrogenase-like predicted oxidoreductase
VPFDKEMGYRVVEVLKGVAARHGASPARVALSWVLRQPAVSSVIVAARKAEQLEDNIGAGEYLIFCGAPGRPARNRR